MDNPADTDEGRTAFAFASRLAAQDSEGAHRMLARSLQQSTLPGISKSGSNRCSVTQILGRITLKCSTSLTTVRRKPGNKARRAE